MTATQLDFLTCFGAEPTSSGIDTPWPYANSTYCAEAGGFKVTFSVHPADKDIELVVVDDGWTLYELKAIGVEDVRVLDFPGCDVFEIWLSKRECLRIQLRPRFGITHGFEKLPRWTGVADI